jgi:hypothetical protein
MPATTAIRPLDPTPRRPDEGLAAPDQLLTIEVDVDCAHLANPVLAVSRLLASEAQAYAHVDGDEDRITVSLVLPDASPASRDHAEAWVRWVIHNAGVRGSLRTVEQPTHAPRAAGSR